MPYLKKDSYEMSQRRGEEGEGLGIRLTPVCRMSVHLSLTMPRVYLNYSKLLSVVKTKQLMVPSRLSHSVA